MTFYLLSAIFGYAIAFIIYNGGDKISRIKSLVNMGVGFSIIHSRTSFGTIIFQCMKSFVHRFCIIAFYMIVGIMDIFYDNSAVKTIGKYSV